MRVRKTLFEEESSFHAALSLYALAQYALVQGSASVCFGTGFSHKVLLQYAQSNRPGLPVCQAPRCTSQCGDRLAEQCGI